MDGLNTKFKLNPVAFFDASVWDINSTGTNGQQQPNYTLNGDGIGEFDLHRISDTTVKLRNYSDFSFWEKGVSDFFNESAISAYYLNSKTNKGQSFSLGAKADYFFTDTITGCSFLAFGNDRHNVVVSHVNSLNFGPAPLRQAEQEVANMHFAFEVIHGGLQYRNIALNHGENAADIVVTVFGWRRADGWHFYSRRRINNASQVGPRRVLDPAPVEI